MSLIAGLIGLVLLIAMVAGAWKGLEKAGFSGAWSLLLLVPVLNLVMLWVFAFVSWPIEDPAARAIARRD